MSNATRRRWGVGLIAGLIAWGAVGIAPAQAQSVPIIVPSNAAIVVGIPPTTPWLVGFPGDSGVHNQGGVTWSTSGRADVDVDISHQHGRAAAG